MSGEIWSWKKDVRLCRSNRGKNRSAWLLWRERSKKERFLYNNLIFIKQLNIIV